MTLTSSRVVVSAVPGEADTENRDDFVFVGAGVFAEIREFGVVGEAGGRSLRASGLGAPPGAVSLDAR